jgi:hypothetical protein
MTVDELWGGEKGSGTRIKMFGMETEEAGKNRKSTKRYFMQLQT